MSSLIHKYEKFIIDNGQILDSVDQTGRIILPFFLREDSLLQSEAGYAILNVLFWYHNSILIKHQKKNKKLQSDVRFRLPFKIGQIMQLVEYLTLMIEMGLVKLAPRFRYPVILVIEILKSILKLYEVYKAKTQTPIYINYKNLPSDESIQEEEQHLEQSTRRYWDSNQNGYTPKLLLAPFDPKFTAQNSHLFLYLGEILHAIRPVIYVISLMKLGGTTSWKPFVISLTIDILASIISNFALSLPQYKGKKGEVLIEELHTRDSNLMYYFIKSPAFELTVKPLLNKIISYVGRVPLIGTLFKHWLEFVLVIQKYFYYSEM